MVTACGLIFKCFGNYKHDAGDFADGIHGILHIAYWLISICN